MSQSNSKALQDANEHIEKFKSTLEELRELIAEVDIGASQSQFLQDGSSLFKQPDPQSDKLELVPNDGLECLLQKITRSSFDLIGNVVVFQSMVARSDTKISTSQNMGIQVRGVLMKESAAILERLDQITVIAINYHNKRLQVGVTAMKYPGLKNTAIKALQFSDGTLVDQLKLKLVSVESSLKSLINLWKDNQNVLEHDDVAHLY